MVIIMNVIIKINVKKKKKKKKKCKIIFFKMFNFPYYYLFIKKNKIVGILIINYNILLICYHKNRYILNVFLIFLKKKNFFLSL